VKRRGNAGTRSEWSLREGAKGETKSAACGHTKHFRSVLRREENTKIIA
jgi:hypothetical protein